jgi:hypothetical protein
MVRQTKGDLHEFLHGQAAPLNDEPNLPIKSHTKPIKTHPGMNDQTRGEFENSTPSAKEVLQDAANLGRPDNDSDED